MARISFNQVTIGGNLVSEPVVKQLSETSVVANFDIAVNRSFKKGDQWEEKTTFIPCVAWNKAIGRLTEAKKGDNLFVQGSLEQERWEKEGEQRSRLRLTVNMIKNLSAVSKPTEAAAEDAGPF